MHVWSPYAHVCTCDHVRVCQTVSQKPIHQCNISLACKHDENRKPYDPLPQEMDSLVKGYSYCRIDGSRPKPNSQRLLVRKDKSSRERALAPWLTSPFSIEAIHLQELSHSWRTFWIYSFWKYFHTILVELRYFQFFEAILYWITRAPWRNLDSCLDIVTRHSIIKCWLYCKYKAKQKDTFSRKYSIHTCTS